MENRGAGRASVGHTHPLISPTPLPYLPIFWHGQAREGHLCLAQIGTWPGLCCLRDWPCWGGQSFIKCSHLGCPRACKMELGRGGSTPLGWEWLKASLCRRLSWPHWPISFAQGWQLWVRSTWANCGERPGSSDKRTQTVGKGKCKTYE